jgi:hypothetical protein
VSCKDLRNQPVGLLTCPIEIARKRARMQGCKDASTPAPPFSSHGHQRYPRQPSIFGRRRPTSMSEHAPWEWVRNSAGRPWHPVRALLQMRSGLARRLRAAKRASLASAGPGGLAAARQFNGRRPGLEGGDRRAGWTVLSRHPPAPREKVDLGPLKTRAPPRETLAPHRCRPHYGRA